MRVRALSIIRKGQGNLRTSSMATKGRLGKGENRPDLLRGLHGRGPSNKESGLRHEYAKDGPGFP